MKTTKPIATISFNSPNFLRLKLDELKRSGIIAFWAFISHRPEDDEGGKKDHIHLFVEPAKSVQTENFTDYLKEFDPLKPDKPKTTLPWHKSDFGNWFMYSCHDRRYLAQKGQSRRFHYSYNDFISSDEDNLLYLYRTIDLMALSPYQDMLDAIEHGVTYPEYFSRGTIALQQVRNMEHAWYLLQENYTNRNGRAGHDVPEFDSDTGEVKI